MRIRVSFLGLGILALSGALVLPGCGGGGDDGSSSPTAASSSNRSPSVSGTVSPTGAAVMSVTVLTFVATGSDPDGDGLTFSWQFGDGQTATGQSASHIYNTAGSFNVIVTASDGRGGSTSANVSVTVRSLTGAWVDEDPRVSFEFTQNGPNFSGERLAGGNFIARAPAQGALTDPRSIAMQITFSAWGITSTCGYQGTADADFNRIRVDRTNDGFWCGQDSYTITRRP